MSSGSIQVDLKVGWDMLLSAQDTSLTAGYDQVVNPAPQLPPDETGL